MIRSILSKHILILVAGDRFELAGASEEAGEPRNARQIFLQFRTPILGNSAVPHFQSSNLPLSNWDLWTYKDTGLWISWLYKDGGKTSAEEEGRAYRGARSSRTCHFIDAPGRVRQMSVGQWSSSQSSVTFPPLCM